MCKKREVTDITELKIKDKKLYLSPIMDLYNQEIISYQLRERPVFTQVISMLKKAFRKTPDTKDLVFIQIYHSRCEVRKRIKLWLPWKRITNGLWSTILLTKDKKKITKKKQKTFSKENLYYNQGENYYVCAMDQKMHKTHESTKTT